MTQCRIREKVVSAKRMKISKIKAAEMQLTTAIRLFFEDRDVVSVHTLVCASLGIIHDNLDEKDLCIAMPVMHYNSIFIKPEGRKEANKIFKKTANFFKHANHDRKKGIDEIEFKEDLNECYIIEACNCLIYLSGDGYKNPTEISIFNLFFALKYPDFVQEQSKRQIENFPQFAAVGPEKSKWNKILQNILENVKSTTP